MSYIWERLEKRREPINRVARRVVQRAKPEDLPSECFLSLDRAAYLEGFNAAKVFAANMRVDPVCAYTERSLKWSWNEGFEEGLYQHDNAPSARKPEGQR